MRDIDYRGSNRVIQGICDYINYLLGHIQLKKQTDVNIINLQNTQILKYDSASGMFVNDFSVELNPSGTATETLTKISQGRYKNIYYTESALLQEYDGSYTQHVIEFDTELTEGDHRYSIRVTNNNNKTFGGTFRYEWYSDDESHPPTAEKIISVSLDGDTKCILKVTATTIQVSSRGVFSECNIYCDIYTPDGYEEVIYDIAGSGGSDVEANPSDTATDDLTKIKIDGTTYNVSSLPFQLVVDESDNGINIVYDDSILNGGGN